ncbi:glyceraldehyde-3-phosphate dehydrogenase [Klebsiella pneumoniae]|uniref:Glyceraldehyde-3-phosphate dehydrogenase n=1 Tax=Klebsiella pneumoniae TaxID=573 RepID=A0A2X1R5F7_KLEPN|nr:glyceraldehyde-3-phosphate dehydrogenase [Klebsiella pneumoniae]
MTPLTVVSTVTVEVKDGHLVVNGKKIRVTADVTRLT